MMTITKKKYNYMNIFGINNISMIIFKFEKPESSSKNNLIEEKMDKNLNM